MLSEDQLIERLRLASLPLVDEIYALVKQQVATESARRDRLEAKASTLLGAAGLALTLASTVSGKLLVDNYDLFGPFGVLLYLFGLLSGLIAAVLALLAVRVRGDNRAIDEDALFSRDELAAGETEEQKKSGNIRYKRFLAAHLWQITQGNSAVQDDKARKIRRGQDAFLAFLLTFGVMWMVVTCNEIGKRCCSSSATNPQAHSSTDTEPPVIDRGRGERTPPSIPPQPSDSR
jgi:hypothetical protein